MFDVVHDDLPVLADVVHHIHDIGHEGAELEDQARLLQREARLHVLHVHSADGEEHGIRRGQEQREQLPEASGNGPGDRTAGRSVVHDRCFRLQHVQALFEGHRAPVLLMVEFAGQRLGPGEGVFFVHRHGPVRYGDLFLHADAAGGLRVLDHLIRGDQVLLLVLHHPPDIRLIYVVIGIGDFLPVFLHGLDFPEPVFPAVFGIRVFPQDAQEEFLVGLPRRLAALFHIREDALAFPDQVGIDDRDRRSHSDDPPLFSGFAGDFVEIEQVDHVQVVQTGGRAQGFQSGFSVLCLHPLRAHGDYGRVDQVLGIVLVEEEIRRAVPV